jgi:hypothetical protein
MSSLAPEETPERKSAFGRCAVIETLIRTGRWLVMEEIVKGAAPDPEEGAYIAEKKGFFSWTRRGRGVNRSKSTGKHALDKASSLKSNGAMGYSKTSIGPDQQAKIQAAALQLHRQEQQKTQQQVLERRGRKDTDWLNDKTNSILTLQPSILNEASPAVKWASKYDKEAIREAYLADMSAGRGLAGTPSLTNGHGAPTEGEQEHRPELPPKPSSPAPPGPVTITSPASVPQRSETPTPQAPKPEAKEPETPKDVPKAGGAGGLKKLFSRKNRSSKVPDNAAEQMRAFAAAEQLIPPPVAPSSPPAPAVPQRAAQRVAQREEAKSASPKEQPALLQKSQGIPARVPVPAVSPVSPPLVRSPVAAPQAAPAPVSESPAPQEISPVSTTEAAPAKAEFTRFDQGPLLDQPAFIPDEGDEDEDDAVPPPIARHSPRVPSPVSQASEEKETAPRAAPAAPINEAHARWAQIRKNAAERAAQRQATEPSARSPERPLIDDASSEESKPTQHTPYLGPN